MEVSQAVQMLREKAAEFRKIANNISKSEYKELDANKVKDFLTFYGSGGLGVCKI